VIGDLEKGKTSQNKSSRLFDIQAKHPTKVPSSKPITTLNNEVSTPKDYNDDGLDSGLDDGEQTPTLNRSVILDSLNDLKRK